MTTYKNLITASSMALATGILASPASAQVANAPTPPRQTAVDEYGVDALNGGYRTAGASLSIGGENGISVSQPLGLGAAHTGPRHSLTISMVTGNVNGQQVQRVQIGNLRRDFAIQNGAFVALDGLPGTLTGGGAGYIYTTADGVQYTFSTGLVANGDHYFEYVNAVASKIRYPNGKEVYFHYNSELYGFGYVHIYFMRLQSVTTNTGYQLAFEYTANSQAENPGPGAYFNLEKITALNNAEEYCDPYANSCTFANIWPNTDDPERAISLISGGTTGNFFIQRPGESTPGTEVQLDTNGRVTSVTIDGAAPRNYSWTVGSTSLTGVSTDSLGRTRTTDADTTKAVVSSMKNALNQTTSYTHDAQGRVTQVTAPEGNHTLYTYDARGNVTEVRRKPKPSVGGADIVTSATYPSTCSNLITCNLPTSTTDARGKTTDYQYNSTTGLVTSIWSPSVYSGRARTIFSYNNRYAKAKNSSGSLVQFANPIATLSTVRQCRTAETCTGSANERVTTFGYNNNTAPNLQPVTINTKTGANTLSQTTSYTYNDLGQVLTADGPLSGTSDTTTYRYDDIGRMVGSIAPDPDGSGFMPRVARRYTYNDRGQALVTETGTVTGTSQSAWNAFDVDLKFVNTYDNVGRLKTAAQVAPTGTTQYSLTQYSYDAVGRPDCVAVRMNALSTSTTLPSSACTKMTAGSFGDDRIARSYYDTADRVTELWSGLGTPLEQRTSLRSYNANGTVSWVEDAKGNRTAYNYDGFDRNTKITYPSKTTPGSTNGVDYELVTYDAGGNILTHRTRRNETITYTYDNLSRVVSKIVPNRSGLSTTHTRNVFYRYDLFGAMTRARFDNIDGQGLTFNYDGLGRPISSVQNIDGMSRTLSYGYNSQGRLAYITHPDSVRFYYNYYHPTGQPSSIQLAGAETIQAFLYTNTGRLRWRGVSGFGNSFRQARYYDGAGRLDRLLITKWGHPNDTQTSYDYNPANQVIAEDTTNQSYVWNGHPSSDVNNTFGANGLNQIGQLNGTNFSYDTAGNLTSDGSTNYVYDVENRLVSVSGSKTGTLRYDPLGRLYEVTASNGNKRRMVYGGDALVSEYSQTGVMLNRYVHGLGGGDNPLVRYSGSSVSINNARVLYKDYRGSVVFEADVQGANRVHTPYDEYGVHGSISPQRFGYTGQAYVPEIGLYYYKARMYSPGLGRFMQTDPIGYSDGMNMYRYVGNDPVNGIDPNGLCTVSTKFNIGWTVRPGTENQPVPGTVETWGYSTDTLGCGDSGAVTTGASDIAGMSGVGNGGLNYRKNLFALQALAAGSGRCPVPPDDRPVGSTGVPGAALRDPSGMMMAAEVRTAAHDATRRRFGRSGTDDSSDAYRHFFGAFVLTRLIGPSRALAILNANEVENGGNKSKSIAMDTFNNWVGIEMAQDQRFKGKSADEAATFALENSCLQVSPE